MGESISALDLMMDLADEIHINTVGAPKPRRRRGSRDENGQLTISAMDFLSEAERSDFEPAGTVTVGGTKAKSSTRNQTRGEKLSIAQAKVREAGNTGTIIAPTVISPNVTIPEASDAPQATELTIVKPDQGRLDEALRELFTSQTGSADKTLAAIGVVALMSKRTADTLDQWFTWEKDRAYRADHEVSNEKQKEKVVDQQIAGEIPPPDDGTGLGLPDYDRNNRKRRPPKNKPLRKPTRINKGKLGLATAVIGGLGLFSMSANASDSASDELANTVVPVDVPTPKAPEVPEGKYDDAVNAAALGGYALSATKRIPLVGTAVSLGYGGYQMNKISESDMTDEEKDKAYTKTGVATGSTIGGAAIGGVIGGFLGSIVPGPGTVIGASFGATLGGWLGDYFGDSIGEYVAETIHDDTKEAAKKRQRELEKAEGVNQLSGWHPNASNINPYTGQAMGNIAGGMIGGMFGTQIGSAAGSGIGVGISGGTAAPLVKGTTLSNIVDNIGAMPLGALTAHFESGNLGVDAISTGKGDLGGVSYGRHQLASTTGSMQAFLDSPEGAAYKPAFGKHEAGTAGFNDVYRQVAGQDPNGFANAQAAFIERTHYRQLRDDSSKALGHDFSKRGRAVQEYMFTFANQYGGYTDAVKQALGGKDLDNMSDADILNAMVDWRAESIPRRFKKSSQAVRDSILKRTEKEQSALMAMVEREKAGDVIATPTAQIDSSGLAKQLEGSVQVAPAAVQIPEKPVQPVEIVANNLTAAATQEQAAPAQQARQSAASLAGGAVMEQHQERNKHNLDDIPVFIDDPMLNMLNVGYM